MNLPSEKYKRNIVVLIYITFAVVFSLLFLFVIKKYLLPFVLAWFLVLFITPSARALGRVMKIPSRAATVLIFSVGLLIVTLFSVYAVGRIYTEFKGLLSLLAEKSGTISSAILGFVDKIKGILKLESTEGSEYVESIVTNAVNNSISELSSRIASSAAELVTNLPSIFFTTFIFLFVTFYMCLDFEKVNEYISSVIPKRAVRRLSNTREKIVKGCIGLVKAYMLLLLLTFSELYIAFSFLKIKYSLAVAIIIALLDILPAIGVGTVLIPWAIFEFVVGNKTLGIFLLVTYGIVTIIRQIAEPHIVGAQFGIHPIAALLSVYVSFRALGIFGLFVAPFMAAIAKEVIKYIRERMSDERILTKE